MEKVKGKRKKEKGNTERSVQKKGDLKFRIYVWVLGLIRKLERIPRTTGSEALVRQLIRSSASVGANYIEAQAAVSRKDFINFLQIALKSANESKYWIALLRDLHLLSKQDAGDILEELDQIARMLGAGIVKLKGVKKKIFSV